MSSGDPHGMEPSPPFSSGNGGGTAESEAPQQVMLGVASEATSVLQET